MVEAQEIIKFWNDGLTATEIGEKIGKTRSAVLGKVNRLRAKGVLLERRVPDKAEPPRGRGSGRRRKNLNQLRFDLFFEPRLEPRLVEIIQESPPATAVDLFSLKPDDCHYIVGREDVGAMYCGAGAYRRSMCKTHYNLCYVRLKV